MDHDGDFSLGGRTLRREFSSAKRQFTVLLEDGRIPADDVVVRAFAQYGGIEKMGRNGYRRGAYVKFRTHGGYKWAKELVEAGAIRPFVLV